MAVPVATAVSAETTFAAIEQCETEGLGYPASSLGSPAHPPTELNTKCLCLEIKAVSEIEKHSSEQKQ